MDTRTARFLCVLERVLSDPEFQRELGEEDRRKWQTFTLRLLAWDG